MFPREDVRVAADVVLWARGLVAKVRVVRHAAVVDILESVRRLSEGEGLDCVAQSVSLNRELEDGAHDRLGFLGSAPVLLRS